MRMRRVIGKDLRGEPRTKIEIGEYDRNAQVTEETRTYSIYEPSFEEVDEVIRETLQEKFEEDLEGSSRDTRVRILVNEHLGNQTTREGAANYSVYNWPSRLVEQEIVRALEKGFEVKSTIDRIIGFFSSLF